MPKKRKYVLSERKRVPSSAYQARGTYRGKRTGLERVARGNLGRRTARAFAMPSKLGKAFTLGVGARSGQEEEGGPGAGRTGPVEPQGPPPAHAALEGGEAQNLQPPPAHSECGSEDGDGHEYSGPEPTDWSSAFFINFLGNSSPRYKIFVIISLGYIQVAYIYLDIVRHSSSI